MYSSFRVWCLPVAICNVWACQAASLKVSDLPRSLGRLSKHQLLGFQVFQELCSFDGFAVCHERSLGFGFSQAKSRQICSSSVGVSEHCWSGVASQHLPLRFQVWQAIPSNVKVVEVCHPGDVLLRCGNCRAFYSCIGGCHEIVSSLSVWGLPPTIFRAWDSPGKISF